MVLHEFLAMLEGKIREVPFFKVQSDKITVCAIDLKLRLNMYNVHTYLQLPSLDLGPEYKCVKYILSFPQKNLPPEKTETN